MNQTVINFTANNQRLALSGEPLRLASKTVNYVKAHFELGENWGGFDSVRAVWSTDFNKGVPAVLDSLGDCVVPHEVLSRAGIVRVNLVGSISEDDVLTDRLTTCLVSAIEVCCNVPVDGTNPQTITPSQFEQFVEAVRDDADRAETASTEARESATEASESATSASRSASASAESATASEQAKDLAQGYAQNAQISAQTAENAKDDAEDARDEILGMRATATTLEEGSEATASYSNGVLTLGIPRGDTGATGAKGDKGDTGATPNLTIGTVETLEPSEPATATITGTAENPVLNLGIPQGDTGEVSLADLSTLLPTDTASGSIASFQDGQSVIPMVSLLADIEPIQEGSGTPSPDNIRPISGHAECVTEVSGKNLFDKTTALDGYIDDANGQLSGSAPYKSTDYIHVVGENSYYIVSEQTLAMWGAWYDESKSYISGITAYANQVITAPSNASYVRLTIKSSNTGNVDTFAVNYPSTDHEYHAYNGNTYTTTLGRTVYGGTLDVVSGELTVDRAMVDLGTLAWYILSSGAMQSEGLRDCKYPTSWSAIPNILCSQYQAVTPNQMAGVSVDKSVCINPQRRLNVYDTNYTDAQIFKTAMQDVQLCYELATPQTYQLDPQTIDLLLGQNNVWTDSGDVEVVYKADVTKWVEKKLNS